MSGVKSALKTLHARKDKSYGGAWKRRGERISVLPNIARKVDRLITFAETGAELQDENIFDTAVDLHVYCLKYLLFLADQDRSLALRLPISKPVWPVSDVHENFNQLIDAETYEVTEHSTVSTLIATISDQFEGLWPAAERGATYEQKFALAAALARTSRQLIARLWHEKPQMVEAFVKSEANLVARDT